MALQRSQWMLLQKKWAWSKVNRFHWEYIFFWMALTETFMIFFFFLLNINRWRNGGLCRSTQWLSTHNSTQILPVWEADLCCTVKEDSAHKQHPVWERRLCSSSDRSDYNQSSEYPSTAPPYLLQLLHDEARVQTQGILCWQIQHNGISSLLILSLSQPHCLSQYNMEQMLTP